MPYYMILDENGNELCNGLSEQTYERAAQNHANRLGETVWAVPSDADEDDDGEAFEPAEPERVHTGRDSDEVQRADHRNDQEKDERLTGARD